MTVTDDADRSGRQTGEPSSPTFLWPARAGGSIARGMRLPLIDGFVGECLSGPVRNQALIF